jgi:hypothetical protein
VVRATENWGDPADEESYDLLREIWAASGLPPEFNYKTHVGYGLDAMAAANLGARKTGTGALAPVQWQRGERGSVIDYCANDIALEKKLFDKIIADGILISPKDGSTMKIRRPN